MNTKLKLKKFTISKLKMSKLQGGNDTGITNGGGGTNTDDKDDDNVDIDSCGLISISNDN